MIFRRNFTTSEQVYRSCITRRPANIINKNLVKTHESNNMRIAAKLNTCGIKGNFALVQQDNPIEIVPLRNKF